MRVDARADLTQLSMVAGVVPMTRGRWVAETLSAGNRRQLWVPEGFAHGFLALEDETEFLYKTTNFYDRDSEGAIRWDDLAIDIDWPLQGTPLVSDKDAMAPAFA